MLSISRSAACLGLVALWLAGCAVLLWPRTVGLRSKDLEAVQGRGYQPSDIRVTPRGLTVTLIPEPAR